ncbi:MAG: MBL fold metallo-hydrolase [Phascolarctobacterium sp.]|nr:MBL fold metallo-hydrolase [Phascolarctobacterium sp.]
MLKKFIVGALGMAVLGVVSLGYAAEKLEGVTSLKVKNFKVYAIDDAQNTFNKSVFPNIDKDADKLAFMPEGKAKGVYRTYLVQNKDRVALIDTGWGKSFKKQGQTVDVLKQMNLSTEAVTDILLTHLDGDHISGLVDGKKAMYPKAQIHMSKAEYEGWLVRGDARNANSIARAKDILKLYEGRISTFDFYKEPIKGIKAVNTAGHTIGHTAFQFGKGKKGLLIVGDVLHVEPLQLRFTDYNSRYDQLPEMAAATRERVLRDAVKSQITIAGMHFASIGKVSKCAEGGYAISK